ncbi:hypothetical protein G6W57_01050 [Streptomyces sp. CAI-121]|uniref:hypothetical protein n=1 Tax=unclassified Streptomyces TaxID=2593676 RepID=UPI00158733A2|nr:MULTISPECIES: hypothetical protein [unclassified Streptomyces]NUV65702.1 hypothetical protein [Streptomyces sp. CAI-121]NUW12439.1 hypothetical protein [Streptomyces sp. CAI-68]
MTDTTPADRPADQLRAAAEKLRATAASATPGPWKMTGVGDFGWSVSAPGVETPDTEQGRTDAELVALMHPGVGLALAVWLDRAADASDHHGLGEGGVVATLVHPALAVARQLLGTTVAEGAEETDEEQEQREDREATARDHAAGDHQHCGITCEVELPTEHLRNFVIAKGYPGTAGALDELLRRAAAPPAPANRAAKRNEIRDSYAETIAMAREDRDHEGAFTLECQLRDREEQWRREDDAAAASPAPADRAAVLREAADHIYHLRATMGAPTVRDCFANGLGHAANDLRRLAADAAAGVQPPTAGQTGDPATDYSYRWSQTIDSVDGGRTALIPGDDCDGNPAVSVWVHRDDAGVLAAMLADFAGVQPPASEARTRIADALADADGWKWAPGFKSSSPSYQEYLRQADVILAALTTPPAAPAAPEEPTCRAGLLPLNDSPVERCVEQGPHTEHTTANGQRWTDAPEETQ